jgi:hypothetical protein
MIVRTELVEVPFFLLQSEEEQGFDKLSPNGRRGKQLRLIRVRLGT